MIDIVGAPAACCLIRLLAGLLGGLVTGFSADVAVSAGGLKGVGPPLFFGPRGW